MVALFARIAGYGRRRFEKKKSRSGIPTYDPIREEAMLRDLTQGNRGRLTDEGVSELLASILYLTKRQLGISAARR